MCPADKLSNTKRGYIIPIGGAEEKLNNPEILDRFVDICGGKTARISIIPTASELDDTGRNYEKLFRRIGIKHARCCRSKRARTAATASCSTTSRNPTASS